jgi:hypothetical protein
VLAAPLNNGAAQLRRRRLSAGSTLAASASAIVCSPETGSRDAVGLQCSKNAPFTLKVGLLNNGEKVRLG